MGFTLAEPGNTVNPCSDQAESVTTIRIREKSQISNIEQGISNEEGKKRKLTLLRENLFPSKFEIPCSIFNILFSP
jgi:hypothetical protein